MHLSFASIKCMIPKNFFSCQKTPYAVSLVKEQHVAGCIMLQYYILQEY